VPLDPIRYKGFLRACTNSATADGITLRALLNGIIGGTYSASLTGQGSFNVSSTSSAGHSVSFDTGAGAGGIGQQDIGKAAELLLEIADWIVAATPALDSDNEALRLAMISEGRMPKRNVNRLRSHICLHPWV